MSNLQSRIKFVFMLFTNLLGLIIVFFILIFVLNYFKILPISKTFPMFSGWLPEQQTAIKKAIPIPASFTPTWEKQAETTLFTNYSDYMKKNYSPIINIPLEPDFFSVNGIFSAYNKNQIQTITSSGVISFKIDKNTVFHKISSPVVIISSAAIEKDRLITVYRNAEEFFKDTPFGSYLKINYVIYKETENYTNLIEYYPDYKF